MAQLLHGACCRRDGIGAQSCSTVRSSDDQLGRFLFARQAFGSAAANVIVAQVTEIKEQAASGLAEALPALDAAVKCLAKLDKSQIVEVKALKKPPPGVKLTLKAVAIMFGVKSVKIADPDNPQKKIDDYWGPSSKMLNDLGPDKFKQALIDFDKDNIPESIIKQIDPICDQDDFTPEAIAKVSVACSVQSRFDLPPAPAFSRLLPPSPAFSHLPPALCSPR